MNDIREVFDYHFTRINNAITAFNHAVDNRGDLTDKEMIELLARVCSAFTSAGVHLISSACITSEMYDADDIVELVDTVIKPSIITAVQSDITNTNPFAH